MTKAIALIALSLTLEAAFLFQISVIARPDRAAAAPTAVAEVVTDADGETAAQPTALAAAPRL